MASVMNEKVFLNMIFLELVENMRLIRIQIGAKIALKSLFVGIKCSQKCSKLLQVIVS